MGIFDFDELFELIEESGTVMYFIPPPERQHLVGCTCTWPNGYHGCSKSVVWIRGE